MTERKNKLFVNIFLVCSFLFFVCFFINVHPIVLTDTDDWWYCCYFRDALPSFGAWNPVRIFAETVMPLISRAGVFGIGMIAGKGHVFMSLTITYAIVVSIAIVALLKLTFVYINKLESTKRYGFYGCAFLLLAHFWIFRSSAEGNSYMLYTRDACTFFYYVIPNLLNVILVLLMMMDDTVGNFTKGSIGKRSAWIVLLYFAMFSNIWASVVTMVYVGICFLKDLICWIKKKSEPFTKFLLSQLSRFIILLLWIVQQIFEMTGGRAGMEQEKVSAFIKIKNTLKQVLSLIKTVNIPFAITFVVIVIAGMAIIIKTKNRERLALVLRLGLIIVLVGIYDFVTCAFVDPTYISRPDVFYSMFYFAVIIELICLFEIIKRVAVLDSLVPLLIIIAVFNCDTKGKTYLDSTIYQIRPEIINAINEDILRQLIEADANGITEIVLEVPRFTTSDNWPYATYSGGRFASFAYEYGFINEHIKVTKMLPTDEKRQELLFPAEKN